MKTRNKITRQLLVVNGIICVAFLVILTVIFFSFRHIETVVTQVFRQATTQIINNATLGRELARILSDTNHVLGIFYGNNEVLHAERDRLLQQSTTLAENVADEQSQRILRGFQENLEDVFEQCVLVNQTRQDIEHINEQIMTALADLDTLVAENIIELSIEGEDISALEQIIHLISRYRESVLLSSVQFGKLGLEFFKSPPPAEAQDHPILSGLNELTLGLQTLTASEEAIATIGYQLLEGVDNYREKLLEFHTVAGTFQARIELMDRQKDVLLQMMEKRDNLVEDFSQKALTDISSLISRVMLLCVGIVFVVLPVVTIGIVTARSIARPLRQIIAHINRLSKGDIPEKIITKYKGEFHEVKTNLNMLIDATQETAYLAEKIANGDLSVTVQERSHSDRLMQALNTMIDSLKDVTRVAEDMANGNLTIEVNARSEQDALMQALNRMITQLNSTVREVKSSAEYVAGGSLEISATADQMSQGAAQQAAAAQQASSSMEEMVANIRQNADNAQITEQIALKSAEDARKGGEAVAKTIEAMKGIAEKISIIQEIAMQTNILSMNATIEAAKAQDYGKGFSVVASEVRALAGRSREAAEKIEELVNACVTISEDAGEVLERLVPNSEKTANLVQEINVASREQYTGAEQINSAIQQLDQVIQQNVATSEQMATSAEELATQAEQLQNAVKFFRVKDILSSSSVEEEYVINALHSLMDDDEMLMNLVKKAIGEKKKKQSYMKQEISKESSMDTPDDGYELDMPADKVPEGGTDNNIDEEFERF